MYEYASVVFRIIILIGVRILFLRSFLQGVWRCPVFDEQQDKSHAFLLSNLKDNAELLGTWREAEDIIMICPKCKSHSIKTSYTNIASLGLGAAKGIANAGYWGFKVASKVIPESLGPVGKLGSFGSRIVAGVIKSGADAIPESATKYHCNKCGYTWYKIDK